MAKYFERYDSRYLPTSKRKDITFQLLIYLTRFIAIREKHKVYQQDLVILSLLCFKRGGLHSFINIVTGGAYCSHFISW